MRRLWVVILAMFFAPALSFGQKGMVGEFEPVCDSLAVLMSERTGVQQELKLKQIVVRGKALDFYFDQSLSDFPFRKDDYKWLCSTLQKLFPLKYKQWKVGEVYANRESASGLAVAPLSFSGGPLGVKYKHKPAVGKGQLLVRREGAEDYELGLSGRQLALWPSHGLYYDRAEERWKWQRAVLFGSVEDLLSTSFVLPYLVPMLENAGAYVIMPRERDWGTREVILEAKVKATALEDSLGIDGVAAADSILTFWGLQGLEKGNYAVYVSHKSESNSTTAARFTIHSLGGDASFNVNQRIGSGIWTYLGKFDLDESSAIEVSNEGAAGSVLSTSAIKIGGGIGSSGMPRYAEAARYWLRDSGAPEEIWNQFEDEDDYKDDLYSRGDWIDYLCGGTALNPSKSGLGVPIDATLAFHSDAGVTPNDSTIGTLVIYTRTNEKLKNYPDGADRRTNREFADIVQSQIVHDLRSTQDSIWQRRQIWARGYRESRTPPTPTLLTESFSHQNFTDMRHALDPAFKFTLSRAIYKGILKYLSSRYDVKYAVQPLPVRSFAVEFGDDEALTARLSWLERVDSIEVTAVPTKFKVYTRIDDGAFDLGTTIAAQKDTNGRYYVNLPIESGNIYSYKITALNSGGESFPSEILSIGAPTESKKDVLVVNNFTRLSAPAWYSSEDYAGFNYALDSGVAWEQEIGFVGEMWNNDRHAEWISDDNAGFGASYQDMAGKPVAGNTFDYVYKHGKAFFEAGYGFCSASAEAFASQNSVNPYIVDVICGKQVTTQIVNHGTRYEVFPESMQVALSRYAQGGGNILISGSHIATDVESSIYPVAIDSLKREVAIRFIMNTFGYRLAGNNASKIGRANGIEFNTSYSDKIYKVDSPDGLKPIAPWAQTIYRYDDTKTSAAVQFTAPDGHKAVSFGFPLEAITDENTFNNIIKLTLQFFEQ